MWIRLSSLLYKELLQFVRDRFMVVLILYFYTGCVIICATALSFDVKRVPTTIVDYDKSPASRKLIQNFSSSKSFQLTESPLNSAEAMKWMQSGRAKMVLVIPERFYRDLQAGQSPSLQLILDGTNSNTAAITNIYAVQVLNIFKKEWAEQKAVDQPRVKSMVRIWYNPDQTFTAFMVLSMITLAAMLVGIFHPAASIVREKETGTIEQLMVTPIRTWELFVAKTTPTILMGLLSIFPSLLIVAWFEVPIRGSLILFFALTALFLFSAISIGVLVAAITKTLQQALLVSFFILFPIMFLSGTLVPIESMPDVLRYLSIFSPLRYYMEIILGIFLKGTGLVTLWLQSVSLVSIGLLLCLSALFVFKRSLR